MKKLIAMLVLVAVVLSFAACTEGSLTKEQYQGTTTTQSPKDETFGLNETAVFDNLKISATEIQTSKGANYFTPANGNVFVGVKFVIENTSDETQTVSSLLMFEGYVDDVKSSYSLSAACVFDEGTLDGDVLPGKKLVGWYALEVPENWTEIEISVKADAFSDTNAVFKFEK